MLNNNNHILRLQYIHYNGTCYMIGNKISFVSNPRYYVTKECICLVHLKLNNTTKQKEWIQNDLFYFQKSMWNMLFYITSILKAVSSMTTKLKKLEEHTKVSRKWLKIIIITISIKIERSLGIFKRQLLVLVIQEE